MLDSKPCELGLISLILIPGNLGQWVSTLLPSTHPCFSRSQTLQSDSFCQMQAELDDARRQLAEEQQVSQKLREQLSTQRAAAGKACGFLGHLHLHE